MGNPDQAGQTDQQSNGEEGKRGAGGKASWWNKLFVVSCTIAVTVDPFFFYIPTIDKDNLCVAKDKRMRAAALVMRGITDSVLAVHLLCLIYKQINPPKQVVGGTTSDDEHPRSQPNFVTKWWTEKVARKVPWISSPIVVDILCLLPIPQIMVRLVSDSYRHTQYLTRQSKRGSSYSRKRNAFNFFLLAQYVPRIYQIHLSSKKVTKSKGVVARGLFNFFLYILASHILGAFWYFFSIQTEISCWNWACSHDSPNPIACMAQTVCSTTQLSMDSVVRNYEMVDKYCSGYWEDEEHPFGLGLFTDSMKFYSTAKTVPFVHRLSYCFWWGLRNLSNFGTSMETSIYTWENVLGVLVSITGLLLFLYLLGNLQAFIGMKTTESVERRKKIGEKMPHVERWITTRYGIHNDDMKKEVLHNISKTKLEQGRDYNLQNLFYFLPWQTRKALKLCIGMDMLNMVPTPERMNVRVIKMMCEYLTPVTYKENHQLFAKDDPIDFMLFIIDGRVLTYSSTSSISTTEDCKTLREGQFYGEELLERVSSSGTSGTTEDGLPKSTHRVVTHREVDAFVLKAHDLKTVFSKCGRRYWAFSNCTSLRAVEQQVANTEAIYHRFRNSRSGVIPTGH